MATCTALLEARSRLTISRTHMFLQVLALKMKKTSRMMTRAYQAPHVMAMPNSLPTLATMQVNLLEPHPFPPLDLGAMADGVAEEEEQATEPISLKMALDLLLLPKPTRPGQP